MLDSAVHAPPRGALRALAGSLVAGAVYDFLFAASMLVAPGLIARTLILPLPGEAFYLRVLAVLLTIAGAVYLVAARDPRRQRALVGIAIAGRCAGFVVMAGSAIGRPELAGLWVPALGDLAFSLLHVALGRDLWR